MGLLRCVLAVTSGSVFRTESPQIGLDKILRNPNFQPPHHLKGREPKKTSAARFVHNALVMEKSSDSSLPSFGFRRLEEVESKIYLIRGIKVMLDSDLASLYEVTTFNLNKAVKRNLDRFPREFMFQL